MHQVALHALVERAVGHHVEGLARAVAAIIGNHAAGGRLFKRPVDHQQGAVHGADDALQLIADTIEAILMVFTPNADNQHADFVLHFNQRFGQATVALHFYRIAGSSRDGALSRTFQHQLALLQQNLAAPLLKRGQFLQQFFAGAQAETATEVGERRIFPVFDVVEQLQGCIHSAGHPGSVIHHGLFPGGTVNTGQYCRSVCIHQCAPRTFSISSGLS